MSVKTENTSVLFVYGTLKSRLLRAILLGRIIKGVPYTLEGFQKVGLNIVPDKNASVPGYLLSVTSKDLRRLDRYERVERRYKRKLLDTKGELMYVYQQI